MSESVAPTEHITLQVPVDCGNLIGNTLRQFAMRGGATWQPAAYRVGPKEGTFGLGGDFAFNYYEFLPGRMLSLDDSPAVPEKLCKFERQGENYVCGDMTITNLGKLNVPRMDVCLVYARGSRTAEQNYAVAERLLSQDLKSFVAVPSRHAQTIVFKFKVKPYDQTTEILEIDATPGSVAAAQSYVVSTFKGLHI